MTKPAAVGMQLFGAVIAFLGIGAEGATSTWMITGGIAMFVIGGLATRSRIKKDQQGSA